MRIGVATAIACALLFTTASAWAGPRWARVSLPAEDAAHTIVVAWNSDAAEDASDVEFGLAANALTSKASGTSFTAKGSLGVVHEVTLSNLTPWTTYHYHVGGADAWSPTYTFRTGPASPCTPFSFIAGGDHRSDDEAGPNPKWKSILEQMTVNAPAFLLESGDLVKDGTKYPQWAAHMTMAEARTPSYPLMPAIGNHDDDNVEGSNAAYNQLFALPKNSATGSEDFYYFTYGNTIVVALSTQTAKNDAFATQAKWLDEVLAAHPDMTWRFVYYHHPSYTSYIDLKLIDLNHPPDEQMQNAALLPVFDKHHVDIVFAGHNHFYERFAPIKGGVVQSTPEQGTIYITSGGTGALTYDTIDIIGFKIEPMKVICGDGIFGVGSGKAKGSQICSGKHHYVEVTIDDNILEAKVISTAAQNLSTENANVGVIDSFTITKPKQSPDPCAPTVVEVVEAEIDAGTGDTGSAAEVVEADVDAGATQPDVQGPPDVPDVVALDAQTVSPDTGSQDAPSSDPGPSAGTDASPVGDDASGAEADPPDNGGPLAADDSATIASADSGGVAQPGQNAKGEESGCSARTGPSGGVTPWASLVFALWIVIRRRAR